MVNYFDLMPWRDAIKATLHSLRGHRIARMFHSQGMELSILDSITCFDCKYKYERH